MTGIEGTSYYSTACPHISRLLRAPVLTLEEQAQLVEATEKFKEHVSIFLYISNEITYITITVLIINNYLNTKEMYHRKTFTSLGPS